MTRAAEDLFIDNLGGLMEESGFPRIGGRILGLLLVTDKPYLSAEQIARRLNASRGSVSTNTHMLIHGRLIERVVPHRGRKGYYRFREGDPTHLLRARIRLITETRKLLEEGIRGLGRRRPRVSARLRALSRFYRFFEQESQMMIDQWEQSRTRRSATRGRW